MSSMLGAGIIERVSELDSNREHFVLNFFQKLSLLMPFQFWVIRIYPKLFRLWSTLLGISIFIVAVASKLK
jgi:glycopeptide antibiotics resistance protein